MNGIALLRSVFRYGREDSLGHVAVRFGHFLFLKQILRCFGSSFQKLKVGLVRRAGVRLIVSSIIAITLPRRSRLVSAGQFPSHRLSCPWPSEGRFWQVHVSKSKFAWASIPRTLGSHQIILGRLQIRIGFIQIFLESSRLGDCGIQVCLEHRHSFVVITTGTAGTHSEHKRL